MDPDTRFALTGKGEEALRQKEREDKGGRMRLTLDGWAALARAEGKAVLWSPIGCETVSL